MLVQWELVVIYINQDAEWHAVFISYVVKFVFLSSRVFCRQRSCRWQEQKANVKSFLKLGKSATETLRILRQAYGNEAMDRMQRLKWVRLFRSETNLKDDERFGKPVINVTSGNVTPGIRPPKWDRQSGVLLRCFQTFEVIHFVRANICGTRQIGFVTELIALMSFLPKPGAVYYCTRWLFRRRYC